MTRQRWLTLGAAAVLSLGSAAAIRSDARACGCFTPPDPSVPVVQAGERILFAVSSGQVTAHIQIQYAGDAADFGWLLPLPSVPTLELGTDELFNQLTSTTQPKYRLTRVYEGLCPNVRGGPTGTGNTSAGPGEDSGGNGKDGGVIVVIQDSIGPYDYAVLEAHSKDAMLDWLDKNHYFVPAGTDGAVGAYLHPGAYFLALKLHSGRSAGDLQPVVVKYASDLPMIPIVLTSVGAQPDMGIQVWILGAGRAIPHNYFHTVLNDAKLDWLNAAKNYNDVIIAATKEADGRHTFITEYAGSSSVMRNVLDAPGRFGSTDELAKQPDAVAFVGYLNSHGYGTFGSVGGGGPVQQLGGLTYPSQLLAILGRYIPEPAGVATAGVTASQFYSNFFYYMGDYRLQHPDQFAGYTMSYKPADMAAEIRDRVVKPALAAGALFTQFPYLTRLYTTLSPEQMNRDPVFSENRTLADVSNVHEGKLTYHCGLGVESLGAAPATIVTEQGWRIQYPDGTGETGPIGFGGGGIDTPAPADLPASQRIEILSEEGPPRVVTDNASHISDQLDLGGCSVGAGGGRGVGQVLLLLSLALLVWRLRRA